MIDHLKFLLNRISERLWVRPLLMCIISTALVFLAKWVDTAGIDRFVPTITPKSIDTLLSIISASMLVIATFAVSSMVSAYASASNTATPRSFSLVIADDVSQNALSTFIGSFIFSIVALIALQNSYYDNGGRFILFALTVILFAMVIITFVSWVDRIARLGRLGATIGKVEIATAAALRQRRKAPTLHGIPVRFTQNTGQPIFGHSIGYIQRVDTAALQKYAEKSQTRIRVTALAGTFSAPGRALAYVAADSDDPSDIDANQLSSAFLIGNDRKFDEDPRFGLIALSEIASRALSPAVNDPGTAIEIIGTFVRLFALWTKPFATDEAPQTVEYDRVEVPELSAQDLFDDAFTGIARDGAGTVEVAVRLQKAFESLAMIGDDRLLQAANRHSRLALARAENALSLPEDLDAVLKIAKRVALLHK